MEVVRLSPNAAEPYHTIGTIHEAKGDPRKALDFYMIAAHLPPKVRRAPHLPATRMGGQSANHQLLPPPQTSAQACPGL